MLVVPRPLAVMHGVVLPQPPAVEKTVRPIGDDILADEENQHLYDERQRRERSVAVLVEGDQALGGSDVKEHGRASDEQADAEIAGNDWNKEPVAHIGDEVALAPPRPARIAGPELGQHGEDRCKRQRDRNALHKHPTDIDDDGEKFLVHETSRIFVVSRGLPARRRGHPGGIDEPN
jgi:hypothetical protein